MKTLLFMAAALLSVACIRSSVRSGANGSFPADAPRTYYWSETAPLQGRLGEDANNQLLAAEFRRELDSELQEKGFRKTSPADAQWIASIFLGVERDVRHSDPQFTVYHTEKIERGHLTMTLQSAASKKIQWQATSAQILRVTDRGMGQDKLRWTDTDEPRDWKIGARVQSIRRELP